MEFHWNRKQAALPAWCPRHLPAKPWTPNSGQSGLLIHFVGFSGRSRVRQGGTVHQLARSRPPPRCRVGSKALKKPLMLNTAPQVLAMPCPRFGFAVAVKVRRQRPRRSHRSSMVGARQVQLSTRRVQSTQVGDLSVSPTTGTLTGGRRRSHGVKGEVPVSSMTFLSCSWRIPREVLQGHNQPGFSPAAWPAWPTRS
jgi:hypothetical protein